MDRLVRLKIFCIAALLFITLAVRAQWEEGEINVLFSIPEVALVDIEPSMNNSVHFSIVPSEESGKSPVIKKTTEEVLWINYSSSMAENVNSRKIVAEIANGQLPGGVQLFLEASVYNGNGEGTLGQPSGKINLGPQPKPLISGIGNCYTNDGANNGHSLNFSLKINDYAEIRSKEEAQFTILYTITDN